MAAGNRNLASSIDLGFEPDSRGLALVVQVDCSVPLESRGWSG